jgi:hypothetical protein
VPIRQKKWAGLCWRPTRKKNKNAGCSLSSGERSSGRPGDNDALHLRSDHVAYVGLDVEPTNPSTVRRNSARNVRREGNPASTGLSRSI